ncbi:major facilitator superfamily MFS_1 [Richelia sinica FACHB-800]|uniref:Major facilitator superfamily MFS_1 n=1 Tax=Richelia sinica FACHB-800 TaxID=1357546 RepID=A0A975Y552_9NOST|nr:MFS transporter [Richelia sinica]MBD2666253.1 MFS transporter [Richelia sinica FACHB-800]QXE23863.1 major facilitator superfamily MFS_1 [Richelia sinica FACHB-800]
MNRNFWITALIAFINSLSVTILIPIIYLYGKKFGLSDLQTSLLFSMYAIAQFFATPVIGKLSDRFGRKPLLIISLAGTVIANLIAGTATTASLVFLGRFLDGITGGNLSVAQAIISDITGPKDRAQAFGIFGAAMGLGFVLGPVTSLLAQKVSLGTAFLVSAAVALIALILTVVFLPETLPTPVAQTGNIFDLGLENLVKGLTKPGVGILLLINFCTGTTFTMFTYAFQPYFINVLQQSSESLTLLFLGFGTMAVIMQTWGVSVLKTKISVVKIMFLGLFFRSLSFVLMPVIPNISYFVIISILFSIFNSLVQPMISTLLSLNAQPQEQGMVMGLNASYLSISNGIGPVIAGVIVQQSHPITYGYPLYLAGILTFAVLFWAVKARNNYTPEVKSV